MNRSESDKLHSEALTHLVGGVNSPVRAFKSVHGNPIYFEKASGAYVTDVDGNVLVDLPYYKCFDSPGTKNNQEYSNTNIRAHVQFFAPLCGD